MKYVLFAGLISIFASVAVAHSQLETSTPAHEAVLTEAPAEVTLVFRKDIRLTRVRLTFAGADTRDLDLGGQTSFTTDFTLPFESQGNGAYVIEWRGLGQDGHALNGTFGFIVE